MSTVITAMMVWIKSDFGGRSHFPVTGLRPNIRFQNDVQGWHNLMHDVEVLTLNISEEDWSGETKLKFTNTDVKKVDIEDKGDLIELLDAYRVIAVGKITSISVE